MRSTAGALTLTVALLVAPTVAAPVWAGQIFFVTSTGDQADTAPGDGVCVTSAGTCTLRAAIAEANALPGLDSIYFAIGAGPQKISPASPLPAITDPVVIDGSTQPGFNAKAIIEITGVNQKKSSAGLTITAGGSTVKRIVINGFADGLVLSGGSGNLVEGNFIGTDVNGTAAIANKGNGILISGSNSNVINKNLVSGNDGKGETGGIRIEGGASGNSVTGNLIGVDISGQAPLGNTGRGVAVFGSSNNQIGPGNVISGNRGSGIRIFGVAEGNLVTNNYVGVDVNAVVRGGLANFAGVQIRSNNNSVISNLIAGNGDDGVLFLWEGNPTGNLVQGNVIAYNNNGVGAYHGSNRNTIVGNSIYGNRLLGIELSEGGAGPGGDSGAPDGVDVNDPGDVDTGTNDHQNYPVFATASYTVPYTIVRGTLNSTPSSAFKIDFFANAACDASGNGEGQYYLGQLTFTTDASGNVAVAAAIPYDLRGYAITATATNPGGSTSEFSKCVTVS